MNGEKKKQVLRRLRRSDGMYEQEKTKAQNMPVYIGQFI